MNDAAVGSALVLPDVTAFHHCLVAGNLKNIRMHEKNEDVGSELELKFEGSAITELEEQCERRPFHRTLVRGYKFFTDLLERAEYIEGGAKHLLFHAALFDNGTDERPGCGNR